MSLNCGHQQAYCLSPTWYMSMESYDGMISTWITRRWLLKAETCSVTYLIKKWMHSWTHLPSWVLFVSGNKTRFSTHLIKWRPLNTIVTLLRHTVDILLLGICLRVDTLSQLKITTQHLHHRDNPKCHIPMLFQNFHLNVILPLLLRGFSCKHSSPL
jgi:hypothetical protein